MPRAKCGRPQVSRHMGGIMGGRCNVLTKEHRRRSPLETNRRTELRGRNHLNVVLPGLLSERPE